jgi:hypothetical protein
MSGSSHAIFWQLSARHFSRAGTAGIVLTADGAARAGTAGKGLKGGKGNEDEAMASLTFEAVRQIGLTLPEVEASTYHGGPALKIRGHLPAWQPIRRRQHPRRVDR